MNETDDDLFRRVTRSYAQAQRLQADCCGTTSTQCQILCAIGAEGSLPQAELGKRLGLEKSWVSRAVDRLAAEGLVERRTCCADARMYDIAFTDKGRERFQALNSALNAQAEVVMSRIPADRRASVRKALELLADAVSSLSGECLCGSSAPEAPESPEIPASAAVLVLRGARAQDLASVEELLRTRGLPTAGFREHLGNFIVAEEKGTIRACGGFERYGADALVRSVAVARVAAGRGVGAALARELERRMTEAGVTRAFLLTDTAREFWEERGFEARDREAAPEALRSSEEFKGACPKCAALMAKNLEVSA